MHLLRLCYLIGRELHVSKFSGFALLWISLHDGGIYDRVCYTSELNESTPYPERTGSV